MIPSLRAFCSAALLFVLGCATGSAQDAQWPTYGGDPGGQRYTASSQITKANVGQLTPAWTFHTGSIAKNRPGTKSSSFETTPILFHGTLYLTSPFDEIFAVNPETGAKLWEFDPHLYRNTNAGILTSRGVAAWASATASAGTPCAARIFVATMDTRLIAVDAANGQPCQDFGDRGSIDLSKNVYFQQDAPFYNSSPPTVVGNVVIVGSGIVDNTRVDLEDGVVRAFDCVTGKQLWSWEPIPWASKQKVRTGAANAWSVIAADLERGLVFIPTGAASPDFYGGTRPGDDRDANSVVALEAATGRRVWGFQVVHHDVWDYDVAAEPLLFTFHGADGKQNVPAIAITTKQGLIFALNRLNGEPLYPVTEVPVPVSDVPGEQASPTQPFQKDLAPLAPNLLPAEAMLGADARDNAECHQLFSRLRYDGMYTPPSLRGSLIFPGNLGGVNWGSAAIDPSTGILYANTNRYAFSIQFFPRRTHAQEILAKVLEPRNFTLALAVGLFVIILCVSAISRRSRPSRRAVALAVLSAVIIIGSFKLWHMHQPPPAAAANTQHFGRETGPQLGTPYTVLRQQLIAPTSGHPCTVMPWGAVSAVNLNTGKAAWQSPLGTTIPGQHTGTVNLGGDIVTATGLLFTGASEEPFIRAFDSATGEELWHSLIPAPAQATPMSYTLHGRQFVVIAAGGHGLFGTPISDAVVAFALPSPSIKPVAGK